MKKAIVRLLSLLLVFCVFITVPMNAPILTSKAESATYNVGDSVTFGEYPQSRVSDVDEISALNSISKNWVSYGYYSGIDADTGDQMYPQDYMRYADFDYDGYRYRAVLFDTYRKTSNEYPSDTSGENTFQDENKYYCGNVYYFKYEPLTWKVLDPASGLVLCQQIIDSQPFQNNISQSSLQGNIEIDYANSSIRNWLNNSFYFTAFSNRERAVISKTILSDNASSDDSVFLLSSEEAENESYGIYSSEKYGFLGRQTSGTEYALCQGLYRNEERVIYPTNYGMMKSDWWLRSVTDNNNYAKYIDSWGYVSSSQFYDTCVGVRPAMKIPGIIATNMYPPENPDHDPEPDPDQERAVFLEKPYIADIWLNQRDSADGTVESKLINTILGLDSLSTGIYNDLSNNRDFMKSVDTWKNFDAVFDPFSNIKDYTFGMTELYESIIFDLLEASLEQENTQNIILDAINIVGVAGETVSKAKKLVDDMLGTIGAAADNLVDLTAISVKEANIDMGKFLKLTDIKRLCDKYTENTFKGYLDAFVEESKSLADFFQMVASFQMALDMADEMKTLLTCMRVNTRDGYLKTALTNVINAVDNADWASFVCTTRFAENTAVNFAKAMINSVWMSNAYTAILKLGYDVGHTVSNLLTNTDGIIDAYYECKAMTSFVEANKKAISSLANTYMTKKDETSAGAYIYAMRMYEHVYLLDFDATLNFVKMGTEEGLWNRTKNFGKSMADYVFHTEHESTYDHMLENRDSIADSMRSHFEFLLNAWKFNENYLKTDYPAIYPVYVAREISKDVYTPKILSAKLNDNGDSEIIYSLDCYYIDEDTKQVHTLYGVNSFGGVETNETIGSQKRSITNNYTYENNKVTFSKGTTLEIFPKQYTVRAFSDTASDRIYTQSSKKQIKDPCKAVSLIAVPGDKGIGIGILDETPVRYQNKKYRIYRKTKSSDYSEIGVIKRASLHIIGGSVAGMIDENAKEGIEYTYKVISELTFNDGSVLRSPASNEFTITNRSTQSGELKVALKDNRKGPETAKLKVSVGIKKVAESSKNDGIVISWNTAENISGYEIYRKPVFGTNYTLIKSLDKSITSYTDTDLEYGVEYDYCVITYTGKSTDEKAYISSSYGKTSTVEPDYIPGDINGDGKVNNKDLVRLMKYLAGENVEVVSAALDINGDGKVNNKDLVRLMKYLAGEDVEIK